jgi:hypothetical protein
VASDRMRQLGAEVRPRLEDVTATGDQPASGDCRCTPTRGTRRTSLHTGSRDG